MASSPPKTIHLGCGKNKEAGAFGVDLSPYPGVDLVHDLEKFPYPIESDHFDRVVALDVLEHLDHFVGAIEEIHRISRDDAEIVISAPFATSLFRHHDPTHRRGLTRLSMDYFIPGTDFHTKYAYSHAIFKKLQFGYSLNENRGWLGRGMRKLANSFPAFYERHLRYVYPMDNVYFVLKSIKKQGPR